MTEILLCNTTMKPSQLPRHCAIGPENMNDLIESTSDIIKRYKPYVLNGNPTNSDKQIARTLAPLPISRELTHLSLCYGEEQLLALSEITAKLKIINIELTGAATSVYADRMTGFSDAVKKYQAALLTYRDAIHSDYPARSVAKQRAHRAFQNLQNSFRHELNSMTSRIKARRGTVLGDPVRATNIARSSRSAVKLNISSQVEVTNLAKFAKQAKLLGNGLAIIDFGSRIGNIHNSYRAKGNWERDLFIESSSFTFSVIASSNVVNVGLSILLIATPAGWIGLLVGGTIVAVAAAGIAIGVNNYTKENAGTIYDRIIGLLP